MNKNIRLNQKATIQVIDDLIRAEFLVRSVVKDGALGFKSLGTAATKMGTKLVANYAKALHSIRNPTKRKIEALNALLVIHAIDYMHGVGWQWEFDRRGKRRGNG